MIAERSPRYHEFSDSLESFLAFCRWSSALVVVFAHARALSFVGYDSLAPGWTSKLLLPFYVVGAMAGEAVIVFFVLSGFLVGGRAAERALAGRFRLVDYTIDRTTRIYCVLIPALALTLLLDSVGIRSFAASGLYDASSPIIHDRFSLPFRDALGPGTLICNVVGSQPHRCPVFGSNIPLWSLSYEIWFYICAGALCYAYQRQTPISIAAGLAALVGLVVALGWSGPVYAVFWVGGAAVYLLTRDPVRFSRLAVNVATTLGLFGIVACNRIPWIVLIDEKPFVVSFFGTGLLFCLILYLRSGLKVRSSDTARTINLKLSDFSYSLYITHFPTIVLMLSILIVITRGLVGPGGGYQPTNVPTLAGFVFAIFIAIIIAWCFSRIFERGSLWVRKRLKARFA